MADQTMHEFTINGVVIKATSKKVALEMYKETIYDSVKQKKLHRKMKIKIITDSKELEEFTSREDISIRKIDIKPYDQNFFAQEWFVAAVMYEENVSANNFDWQSFRAEAAKDIMCAMIGSSTYLFGEGTIEKHVNRAVMFADMLIEKLKK